MSKFPKTLHYRLAKYTNAFLIYQCQINQRKTGHPFLHGAPNSLCVKPAVKDVPQFAMELMSTMKFKALPLLISYVALKASEVVLDGHREVLLAVLQSQAAGVCHSGEFQWGPCQWSCWWCFLSKPNPGTALVSCSQTTFTKAIWLLETRTASHTSWRYLWHESET